MPVPVAALAARGQSNWLAIDDDEHDSHSDDHRLLLPLAPERLTRVWTLDWKPSERTALLNRLTDITPAIPNTTFCEFCCDVLIPPPSLSHLSTPTIVSLHNPRRVPPSP